MRTPNRKQWPLLRRLLCLLSVALICASCSAEDDSDKSRDATDGDIRADVQAPGEDASPDASTDASNNDATLVGPPDTSSERFVDTQCYERRINSNTKHYRCTGNVGCTEKSVVCGDCVCVLCADEYCLTTMCDDGGSPECPGFPWDGDAG